MMLVLEGGRLLIGVACALLFLACASEVGGSGEAEQGGALHLDLARRTLEYPLGATLAAPVAAKFVQVEIGALVNPRPVRITFELRYRPPDGAEILLGTFSPFPPDNPGTFIVATGGMLQAGGVLLLTLVPLDAVGAADEVEVDVRSISLRPE